MFLRMKTMAFFLSLLALSISCAPKPVPYLEPPVGKAILYHLPMGGHWLRNFPHNSLGRQTSIEECEAGHWYKNRSGDLGKAYSKFKSLIQRGDAIWIWSGENANMFNIYRGVDVPSGICLLRNNKIIAVLMTEMTCNIE
jgi:hypothetical protein